jgi:hypothetical protein
MGAWGIKVFEDDSALDFLEEQLIPHADPRAAIRGAFEAAVGADYLEYDVGQAVLVSATVVVSARDGQPLGDSEPEEWAVWRKGLVNLDFTALTELGSKACARVCSDASELRELWEENEDLFSAWKSNVESLAQSLKSTRSEQ